MPKLRVRNFSISLDGFGAGPDQSVDNPLGVGGEELHRWMFATRWGREMFGGSGGDEGIDNDFAKQLHVNIGATIMGRNMFGPVRGPWGDENWKGWWGDEPPYHHPVFVLSHHAHPPIPMEGGTTFHFVTDGIESAREQALEAAGGKDVIIGGGVSTIQQYMRAGLVDELHVVIGPVFLRGGERLFDDSTEGYECVEFVASPSVAHVRLERTKGK